MIKTDFTIDELVEEVRLFNNIKEYLEKRYCKLHKYIDKIIQENKDAIIKLSALYICEHLICQYDIVSYDSILDNVKKSIISLLLDGLVNWGEDDIMLRFHFEGYEKFEDYSIFNHFSFISFNDIVNFNEKEFKIHQINQCERITKSYLS